MFRLFCIFGTIFFVVGAPRSEDTSNRADVDSSNQNIILNGYVAEAHQAVTEDGYILTMQRIPYTRGETSAPENRPVVFVMHGLYGSSPNFIFMGPEYSIGYHLADAGFDVWFGNSRGNINSRSHVSLDLDDPEDHLKFFDFSWEEIGIYDLPAMIDYVLNYTGQEKLHYIGHSQGGTVFLVLGSMRPEYNEKLASAHLLAGVGYQDYFPNEQLTPLAMLTDLIYSVILSEGLVEVDADLIEMIQQIAEGGGLDQYSPSDLCFGDLKYRYYCQLIGMRYLLRDDDEGGLMASGLGGGSVKQIAHYGQNIRDKLFRRFHYGSNTNQELYGSADPPMYNLGLITTNVTMHYTISDDLLDERDVLAMAADMPNTVARKVARDSFEHNDFIAAVDAKSLVTDFIVEAIQYVHDNPTSPDLGDGGDGDDGDDDDDVDDVTEPTTVAPTTAQAITTTIVPEPVPVTDSAVGLSLTGIFRVFFIVLGIYTLV